MKQQTAVEWFFNELSEVERNLINKTFLQNNKSLAGNKLRGLFEQAKEMEKQQILKAYETAMETDIYNTPLKVGKQYYEETFKKQTNDSIY